MSRDKQEKGARKQPTHRRRPRWLWPGLGAILIVAAVIAALLWPRSLGTGVETQTLPAHGDQNLLTIVQSFPDEGQTHVPQGTNIDYHTSPPTSGSHYDTPISAGFYTEFQNAGNLVHSLEHGAVVIYYDPKELTDKAKRSLQAFVSTHRDPWASVIVVPDSEKAPDTAYALTAWTKMLKTNTYDVQVVRAFLADYMGRGPERPTR